MSAQDLLHCARGAVLIVGGLYLLCDGPIVLSSIRRALNPSKDKDHGE